MVTVVLIALNRIRAGAARRPRSPGTIAGSRKN
jgi:hypothetical protein